MKPFRSMIASSVLLALGSVASAQQAVQLKIAAQPLNDALAEFAQQSGLQLIASSELTKGMKAAALEGSDQAAGRERAELPVRQCSNRGGACGERYLDHFEKDFGRSVEVDGDPPRAD